MLAFALSFDEIIVTTFTAGSERTLPIWLLNQLGKPRDTPITNVVAMMVMVVTMTENAERLMPASAEISGVAVTEGQRVFLRYYTGFLMDLVVLNLFAEWWSYVYVSSFTVSLLAALVLQALLKATIAVEHKVALYWKAKGPGKVNTFMRYFCAWLVLFGSKFVILEALSFAFGDKVRFEGRFHGLLTLIVVVVVMLVAEELMVRVYRRIH